MDAAPVQPLKWEEACTHKRLLSGLVAPFQTHLVLAGEPEPSTGAATGAFFCGDELTSLLSTTIRRDYCNQAYRDT